MILSLRRSLSAGFFGKLLSCFYCLSIWIAIPFVFFLDGTGIEKVVAWLALSGAAILLERMTGAAMDIRIEE